MKNIRSKVVRESLLDYNTLAKSLQENTEGAVKNLLSETVRDTYAKLLSEDFEEDEVDDVDMDGEVEDTADASGADDVEGDAGAEDGSDGIDAGMEADADAEGGEGIPAEGGEEPAEGGEELGAEGEADAEGDDWAEFDKYKVSDDEYDFSNAEDEEIVKVYKLMKNDDQILVHKDDDKVKIQDNETGAEYIVDLGGDSEAAGVAAVEPGAEDADAIGGDDVDSFDAEGGDMGDDFSGEDSEDEFNNNEDDMNESTERMFELVLEYDSNVGYTDNYQKKDVMTTPGMSEPGKNVNDWDAGVPKGKAKPWSGKKGDKSENQPFDGEKGKTVEESIHTVTQNGPQRRSTTTIQAPDTSRSEKVGRNLRLAKIPGQKKGTGEAAYTGVEGESTNKETNESIIKKVNKTLKENKELKETLNTVMASLKEAAVTNHNLAQIIKLISENSTTKEEKEEIIRKFANEAKTIDASKTLYESISNDLKKAKKMNITEDKNLSVESSKKINETPIYKSQDIMESLDLMHRMMR